MLVISHKNCWDGMASAWVLQHKLSNWGDKKQPRFEFLDYGDPFPEFNDGEDIAIVDFSFPGTTLVDVCKKANYVVVLDHHEDAINAINEYFSAHQQPINLDLRLRTEMSGVGLTWKFAFPREELPPLLACVQDRDLWKFQIEHTKPVMAYVGMFPNTLETFDALMKKDFNEILEIGAALHMRNIEIINWHLENAVRVVEFAGYTVPLANGPRILRSELGEAMLNNDQDYPFSINYADLKDGRFYSFRSKQGGFRVDELVKKYGGSGHPHAAGLRVEIGTELSALNPV